ncbi:MAG: ERF family protein [Eubacteriales bacterium]|jgi:hypothetical protein
MENKNIAGKLVHVMQACSYVQKDAENKEQKYRYVSAAAVLEKINPALVANNLVSIPEFSLISEKEKSTARGGIWQLVTVQCKLMIIDADSGEVLNIVSLGTGTDPGDKATSKAQTAALKYAWLTALNIETGDDPEADPRTDHELGQDNPQGGPPMPPPMLPGIGSNPLFQEICRQWGQLGWGGAQELAFYLEQRFKKSADQVSEAELIVVANEAIQYLQQRRY